MEEILLRALAVAARAFADEIERGLPPRDGSATAQSVLERSTGMTEVLRLVTGLNDREGRGATDEEMRAVARRADMDPRGLAGYYAAKLLEKRPDGSRWVTPLGRDRLQALSRVVMLDTPPPEDNQTKI